MIITKTPFRVSFCGGGSDISDFYKEHGGCVLSTSINKYMYISVHPYFNEKQIALKYSKNEIVDNVGQIKHRIMKQVLMDMKIDGVEIVSTADVPSGTGLGSSSAFTVGLLHALNCYKGKYVSQKRLAEEACKVEIEKLGAPIGKQDQYAAACGGLNMITFHQNNMVTVKPIIMGKDTYRALEENLVMFYTGITHDANNILAEQKQNIAQKDKTANLLKMCDLARQMESSLEENDISQFGYILNQSWQLKKQLASGISGQIIDEMYDKALNNGAMGGKLLGAGGGGFLLFYCEKEKQQQLQEALGLKRFDFRFDFDGTSVVYVGDRYW